MAARCLIVKGPGKFLLSNRFFDEISRREHPLGFKVKSPSSEVTRYWEQYGCDEFVPETSLYFDIRVLLDLIEWESGSGNEWNFRGRLAQPHADIRVRGYFSTKNPDGWIVFETDEEARRRELINAAEKLVGLLKEPQILIRTLDDLWLKREKYEDKKREGLL